MKPAEKNIWGIENFSACRFIKQIMAKPIDSKPKPLKIGPKSMIQLIFQQFSLERAIDAVRHIKHTAD